MSEIMNATFNNQNTETKSTAPNVLSENGLKKSEYRSKERKCAGRVKRKRI